MVSVYGKMTKNLYIVGAGGFGREVFSWARQSMDWDEDFVFSGFLDDNPKALTGLSGYGSGVVGKVLDFNPGDDDRFILAIGWPEPKRATTEILLGRGAIFESVIHPNVVLGANVKLGQGVVVCPGAVISSDAEVEGFVGINMHATVSHDVRVGAFSQLSSYVDLTGCVEVGEGVFLGSHSSVLPGVKVGAGATVGAGAVCVHDVPEGSTVTGVPAKVLTMDKAAK